VFNNASETCVSITLVLTPTLITVSRDVGLGSRINCHNTSGDTSDDTMVHIFKTYAHPHLMSTKDSIDE
jgi:hypothetical protein